jgi:hypothetical protein
MEVSGIIKLIGKTISVTDSFKKREIVVTTDEQYPQHILIEFAQDKCSVLEGYNLGENVKVSINLRGREWINPQGETKYFNQIQGWRIEKLSNNENNIEVQNPIQVLGVPNTLLNNVEDDLPF